MARSISDIQKKSDERRGLKVKGIKLHVDTITLLEQLSEQLGIPQSQVVTRALYFLAEHVKDTASE